MVKGNNRVPGDWKQMKNNIMFCQAQTRYGCQCIENQSPKEWWSTEKCK